MDSFHAAEQGFLHFSYLDQANLDKFDIVFKDVLCNTISDGFLDFCFRYRGNIK